MSVLVVLVTVQLHNSASKKRDLSSCRRQGGLSDRLDEPQRLPAGRSQSLDEEDSRTSADGGLLCRKLNSAFLQSLRTGCCSRGWRSGKGQLSIPGQNYHQWEAGAARGGLLKATCRASGHTCASGGDRPGKPLSSSGGGSQGLLGGAATSSSGGEGEYRLKEAARSLGRAMLRLVVGARLGGVLIIHGTEGVRGTSPDALLV
jgi:hypothetical protein